MKTSLFSTILFFLLSWSFSSAATESLASQLQSQCSNEALGMQSEAEEIGQKRMLENQKSHELLASRRNGQTAPTEIELTRSEREHRALQLTVEKYRYRARECFLAVLKKKLGDHTSFSQLSRSEAGRASLKEIQDLLAADRSSLRSSEEALRRCLQQKSPERETCQSRLHTGAVPLYEQLSFFEDLETFWKNPDSRFQKQDLTQYGANRLAEVRESLQEINETSRRGEQNEVMQRPDPADGIQ